MVKKVFAIMDSKAKSFFPPFLQNTHGEAERTFQHGVNNEQSMLNKYPEDYDLYYLGEFDEANGKFACEASPQHMIKGVQVLRQRHMRVEPGTGEVVAVQ